MSLMKTQNRKTNKRGGDLQIMTKKRICSVMLIMLISSLMLLLAACGNSAEKYEEENKDFSSDVEQLMQQNGFTGDVSIDKDNILVTVDASDSVEGIEVTDELKDDLKDIYETNFDRSSDSMSSYLSKLREEVGSDDVNITIKVMLGDEELTSRTFK